MPIGFIGDVHGKFGRYKTLIKHAPYPTVQVGDMGVGFVRSNGDPDRNPPHRDMVKGGHRFIRGNHDSPNVCRRHSQWIPDGHVETIGPHKIMYIGGAWSIDRDLRTEGINWWADEQLSIVELDAMIDQAREHRPDIMVTHDFPGSIAHKLFLGGTHKPVIETRTGQALDSLFFFHKPKLWVAGHWHESRNVVIDGTRFVCLAELEYTEVLD